MYHTVAAHYCDILHRSLSLAWGEVLRHERFFQVVRMCVCTYLNQLRLAKSLKVANDGSCITLVRLSVDRGLI